MFIFRFLWHLAWRLARRLARRLAQHLARHLAWHSLINLCNLFNLQRTCFINAVVALGMLQIANSPSLGPPQGVLTWVWKNFRSIYISRTATIVYYKTQLLILEVDTSKCRQSQMCLLAPLHCYHHRISEINEAEIRMQVSTDDLRSIFLFRLYEFVVGLILLFANFEYDYYYWLLLLLSLLLFYIIIIIIIFIIIIIYCSGFE